MFNKVLLYKRYDMMYVYLKFLRVCSINQNNQYT